MSLVPQIKNRIRKPTDLTELHYETLLKYASKDFFPNVIYNPPIKYVTPMDRINLELLDGELIKENPKIGGLFELTQKGKAIVSLYISFYSLQRDAKDKTFDDVETEYLKGQRRK